MITLFINALIITLLAGAICYIYIIDSRVRKLLSALNALEPMVGQFSQAVDQSETSLKEFKTAASAVVSNTQDQNTSTKANKTRENNLKPPHSHVERVSLPEKRDLVRSFFETARTQKL